jgi:hypothetical protein
MNPPFIVVSSTMWITYDARNAHRRISRLIFQLYVATDEQRAIKSLIWIGTKETGG